MLDMLVCGIEHSMRKKWKKGSWKSCWRVQAFKFCIKNMLELNSKSYIKYMGVMMMCVSLAVENVNVPFENELVDQGYERILFVDQDEHALYFEAHYEGEAVEVKIVTDQEDKSIWDRLVDCEDWNLVDFLS